MDLHGSIEENLIAAVRSARRLRGHPVYPETLNYWADLLHQARHELTAGTSSTILKQLVVELKQELAEHPVRA